MKTKVLVATHKNYTMPTDELYLPIHVGADLHSPIESFVVDNTGENISAKNKNYCELTGIYWAWKNLKDTDAIGLCHYRRFFCEPNSKTILTGETANRLLQTSNIILPKKRNYFIETNYNQYIHAHHEEDLVLTRQIMSEQQTGFPNYVEAFDSVMKETSGHRFNMFVMSRNEFDSYCEWLFPILFELEERLDISQYSDYDARVFGFVSERLLDVWLLANNKKYVELPYVFTEKENWIIKGGNFLKRKFFPQKK